jgi:hypothetical protein
MSNDWQEPFLSHSDKITWRDLWEWVNGFRYPLTICTAVAICGWLIDQPWLIYLPFIVVVVGGAGGYLFYRVRNYRVKP